MVIRNLMQLKGDVKLFVPAQDRYTHLTNHSALTARHLKLHFPPILFVITHPVHRIR